MDQNELEMYLAPPTLLTLLRPWIQIVHCQKYNPWETLFEYATLLLYFNNREYFCPVRYQSAFWNTAILAAAAMQLATRIQLRIQGRVQISSEPRSMVSFRTTLNT